MVITIVSAIIGTAVGCAAGCAVIDGTKEAINGLHMPKLLRKKKKHAEDISEDEILTEAEEDSASSEE